MRKHFFILALLFGFANLANAQEFRISLYGQQAIVTGDFAEADLTNPSSGYAEFGSVSGFEFQYYPTGKWGFGIRSSFGFYDRSRNTYESDLAEALNLSTDFFDLTGGEAFFTGGSDLGASYRLNVSEQFTIEPYFCVGFRAMRAPQTWLVFSQEGTTFNYRTKSEYYFGTAFAPGARFHFNVSNRFGINIHVEYASTSFAEETERTLLTSDDTFVISDFKRDYSINSVNAGISFWFSFGADVMAQNE